MNEIERKFLVSGDFSKEISESIIIKQAYLSRVPERVVRIRTANEKAFITIKGKSTYNGLSRFEFETEIPFTDAQELFKICEPGEIDKTRNIVFYKNQKFEVDVFRGKNEGLILAEIELKTIYDKIEKPQWLGKEVTGDDKYYNSKLSK